MAIHSRAKRPILFVGRSDRLMARIKAMIDAWRFIDQVDGQLFVVWPKLPSRYSDENVGFSPSNIFDLVQFYADGGADRLCFIDHAFRYPTENAHDLGSAEFAHGISDGFDRRRFAGSGDIFVRRGGTGRHMFTDEPRDSDYYLSAVRRLFGALPVHPKILEMRNRFYDKFDLAPGAFGAVHFRRGDVYEMLRHELSGDRHAELTDSRFHRLVQHFIMRTAPLEFYAADIERMIADGKKIVFASDTPSTISDFQSAFGREHFVDLSQSRMPIKIQKAFLDFLVLTDASEIIGTTSNFTQYAAELGNRHFNIVSGTGAYDIVHREFSEAILAEAAIDSAIGERALEILAHSYADYSKTLAAR